FREAGAIVHTGAVAGFTHIWASTYRGRRWLLFGRELVRLPSHVRQFNRTLRNEHFELVHFNDSPLIPAACPSSGICARRCRRRGTTAARASSAAPSASSRRRRSRSTATSPRCSAS